MNEILLKLLNQSITASWLIIVVIVLRLFLKKAPKWLSCILWAIVAIRLLCPFSIESSLSFIPDAEPITFNAVSDTLDISDTSYMPYIQGIENNNNIASIDKVQNSITDMTAAVNFSAGNNRLNKGLFLAGIVWIIGFIGIFGFAFVSFCKIYYRVREAIPLQDNIWLCDMVGSPFIIGIIKPRIYLSSSISCEQIQYVLSHEQAHLKRKDHWWKAIGYFLLAVYWFHPLVWIAYLLFCRDIEFACDEKVIRDMDIDEKKAYSKALVSCSLQKRAVMVYPVAFGEVQVKERVKTVLQYKKPAFWVIAAVIVVCAAVAACFLTNPKKQDFTIRIVIPAGSEEKFCYSHEEISPVKNRITMWAGEGLSDTEVVLKPVKMDIEQGELFQRSYHSSYITPGMPIKMDIEKGEWFQIGVSVQNPTDKDMEVFVCVKGVEVRIASKQSEDLSGDSSQIQYNNNWYDKKDLSEETIKWLNWYNSLSAEQQLAISYIPQELDEQKIIGSVMETSQAEKEDIMQEVSQAAEKETTIQKVSFYNQEEEAEKAISAAILEKNMASSHSNNYDLACCDFMLLETEILSDNLVEEESIQIVAYYGWALYQEYQISEEGIKNIWGSYLPIALTFEVDENGYKLKEYWQPREGSYFALDVRSKFPKQVAEDGIDSQKFGMQQIQNCYKQAVQFGGLYPDTIINNLLNNICSSPKIFASNPQDYIDAHITEYHELMYYGEYTLSYCFERFSKGNETGLEGKIMALVCEAILQTEDSLPVNASTAETGQFWYDTLYAHASNKVEPYLP